MKYLFFILLSFNIYAECISTSSGSIDHVPIDAGINKLVEQNCSADNANHREVILRQQIKSQEDIEAASMNLKYDAINKSLIALDPNKPDIISLTWETYGLATFTLTGNSVETISSGSPYGAGAISNEGIPNDGSLGSISFKINSSAGSPYFHIGFDDNNDSLAGDNHPDYGIFVTHTSNSKSFEMVRNNVRSSSEVYNYADENTIITLSIEEENSSLVFKTKVGITTVDTTPLSGVTTFEGALRFLAALWIAPTTVTITDIQGFKTLSLREKEPNRHEWGN